MDNTAVEAFATALIAARRDRQPILADRADELAALVGPDGALAVQHLVAQAYGPVVGWKASRPTPDGPGVMAPVLAGMLRPSGAAFTRRELFSCGIELEIAFRIDAALPAPDAADFDAKVRAAVTPIAAIEIIDGRMADFTERIPLAKLADNQINGGLVAGAAGHSAADLQTPEVKLTVGAELVLSGRQTVPGGDAFATLLWLARSAGEHLGGLGVGQVVTTGALGGMRFVSPGTIVEGWIAGLGSVAVTFD